MKRILSVLILGLIGGLLMGLGGFGYFYCIFKYDAPIYGSLLFTLGLVCCCLFSFFLYTGKIGYAFENKFLYFVDVLLMLFSNFIGATLLGFVFSYTNEFSGEILREYIATKMVLPDYSNWFKIFLMAFVAGMLILLAVQSAKKLKQPIFRLIMMLMPISIMILIGGENSVANFFYFAACYKYIEISEIGRVFLSLFLSILGNMLGALFFYNLMKLPSILLKKEQEINE